jgi:hypothetical protein
MIRALVLEVITASMKVGGTQFYRQPRDRCAGRMSVDCGRTNHGLASAGHAPDRRLVFAAAESSLMIRVPIIKDTLKEPAEMFASC